MSNPADQSSPAAPTTGEVVLTSRDIAQDLRFFIQKLGFRLEKIFPSDSPAVAVVSGHGLRLRLTRDDSSPPGKLRLACAEPLALAKGQTELVSPGGTKIKIRANVPNLATPQRQREVTVQRLDKDAAWSTGRAGMLYRDLIPGRLGGSMIASHIRIPHGGPVPDMVHFHTVRFQLIYCYHGWVRLVYEDQGPPFILSAGDCVTQPPQIRHRVLEASDNLEVIEIGVPADHITTIDHALDLPTAQARPDRLFDGQRFCHHQAARAQWRDWRLPGFQARDTGVGEASGGLAGVQVARRRAGGPPVQASHDADILFAFVLQGSVTLEGAESRAVDLSRGDTVTIPPGRSTVLAAPSDDLELLEVTLPARFETTILS